MNLRNTTSLTVNFIFFYLQIILCVRATYLIVTKMLISMVPVDLKFKILLHTSTKYSKYSNYCNYLNDQIQANYYLIITGLSFWLLFLQGIIKLIIVVVCFRHTVATATLSAAVAAGPAAVHVSLSEGNKSSAEETSWATAPPTPSEAPRCAEARAKFDSPLVKSTSGSTTTNGTASSGQAKKEIAAVAKMSIAER